MLLQLPVLWCYDFNHFIVHICEASSTILKSREDWVLSNACVVACLMAVCMWMANMKYHSSKMLAKSLVEHCAYSTFAMSMPIDMQAFIR